MLARYELTKPREQQVAAAIKQRNRTKFRWGTTKSSSSSGSSTARSDCLPSHPSPPTPSRRVTTANSSHCSQSSQSSRGNSRRRCSSVTPRRPLQLLEPITESELEDATSDDDTESLSLLSPASSHTSATSSPDASFASVTPSLSLSPTAATAPSPLSLQRVFQPRVEYDTRKLLRTVMGLDSVWASDQQVVRHYAHLKWRVVRIQADGNCLFRAISDQLYGSEAFHGDLRQRVVDFIEREGSVFQPFLATDEASAETLAQYCRRMRRDGAWGGNPELYAAAKLLNLHIIVHQGPMRRVRIENGGECDPATGKPPLPNKVLHLLYKSKHYKSLRPPPDDDNDDCRDKKTQSRAHLSCSSSATEVRQPIAAATAKKQQQVRTPETLDYSLSSNLERQSSERSTAVCRAAVELAALDPSIPSSSFDTTAAVTDDNDNDDDTVVYTATARPTDALDAAARVAAVREDAGVRVYKPTRMVFRRGRPEWHSLSSTSTASASSDTSAASSSASDSVAMETSDKAVATADDNDDDLLTRITYPTRRAFHRGVSRRRQEQQHVTAAG